MTIANPAPLLDLTSTAVRALMLYSLLEFQSGHATTIRVTAEGNAFSIADNGRGHPLDKTVDGTSYLKFIYTHFDYPFDSDRGAEIQLQGIGIFLVNAMCSALTLTVKKRDATLQMQFRDGQLCESNRAAVVSEETGITISAQINPQLQGGGTATEPLEAWLLGVLAVSPSLKLYFNGRQLHAPATLRGHT